MLANLAKEESFFEHAKYQVSYKTFYPVSTLAVVSSIVEFEDCERPNNF